MGAAGVELEDPEVGPEHRLGDVVDRALADHPVRGSGVGMAVEDEVRAVLEDRRREVDGVHAHPAAGGVRALAEGA